MDLFRRARVEVGPYAVKHQDDAASDQYWQVDGTVTVFGFGRQYRRCAQYLNESPRSSRSGSPGTAYRDFRVSVAAYETYSRAK